MFLHHDPWANCFSFEDIPSRKKDFVAEKIAALKESLGIEPGWHFISGLGQVGNLP